MQFNSDRMDQMADKIEEQLEKMKEDSEWGMLIPMTTTRVGN